MFDGVEVFKKTLLFWFRWD